MGAHICVVGSKGEEFAECLPSNWFHRLRMFPMIIMIVKSFLNR
jgi:hypothetical protein